VKQKRSKNNTTQHCHPPLFLSVSLSAAAASSSLYTTNSNRKTPARKFKKERGGGVGKEKV
jgi:hypothetical protein